MMTATPIVDPLDPAHKRLIGPFGDVDNDGDGTPDSVWVDFGYPVQATADGKLFKPLVAVLLSGS